jgi:hypothetical protein
MIDYLSFAVKKTKIDVADQSLIIGPEDDAPDFKKPTKLKGKPQKILVMLFDKLRRYESPTLKPDEVKAEFSSKLQTLLKELIQEGTHSDTEMQVDQEEYKSSEMVIS